MELLRNKKPSNARCKKRGKNLLRPENSKNAHSPAFPSTGERRQMLQCNWLADNKFGKKLPMRNELANPLMLDEVKEAVQKLKLRKSPGGDDIVTRLIINCGPML